MPDRPSLQRRDWILLAIGAGAGSSLSPVQLQKSLFILGKELTAKERLSKSFYEFKPYDYGPFDQSIYSDAEDLEQKGLVSITQAPLGSYRRYGLTQSGTERYQELSELLSEGALEFLGRVVTWVRRQSFQSLVRAIYQEYPDMKANSVFQD
jgi:hypothetical protein